MNTKKKKVIFIYEGVKAEENLLNNMVKTFFSSKADISILNCPADGNIYMLWTRLKKDEFETNVIDVLKEMLKTFNNETELGKLYVSYPMIESIKEIDAKTKEYKNLYLALDEISHYKQSFFSQADFNNYNCIDKKHWLIACKASQKRASLLVTYSSSCTYNYFIHNLNQENLYFHKKQNYINNGHLLCILNSVPLFLLEYYEEDFWDKVTAI